MRSTRGAGDGRWRRQTARRLAPVAAVATIVNEQLIGLRPDRLHVFIAALFSVAAAAIVAATAVAAVTAAAASKRAAIFFVRLLRIAATTTVAVASVASARSLAAN